MVVNILGAVV